SRSEAGLRPLVLAHLQPMPVPLGTARAGPAARRAHSADLGVPGRWAALRRGWLPLGVDRRGHALEDDRRLRHRDRHRCACLLLRTRMTVAGLLAVHQGAEDVQLVSQYGNVLRELLAPAGVYGRRLM